MNSKKAGLALGSSAVTKSLQQAGKKWPSESLKPVTAALYNKVYAGVINLRLLRWKIIVDYPAGVPQMQSHGFL